MDHLLSEKEIQYLKEHFYLENTKQESELSIDMKKLMDPDILRIYISKVKNRIDASNTSVAASMFSKRYSFLAVLTLYTMTAYNKAIDVSIENISLESNDKHEFWMPSFRFQSLQTNATVENRNEWRDIVLQKLFAENVDRLFHTLSKETKISKYILWENIAVYIFWLYETMLENKGINRERVKEDAEYVILKAKGHLFGNYRSNPLSRYFHSKQFVSEIGKEVRIRSTCCLAYLSDKGIRCHTCPYECNVSKSH